MARIMKTTALISACLMVFFILASNFFDSGIFTSAAVSFGTIFYHFAMRLMVGSLCDMIITADGIYKRKIYSVKEKEMEFYRRIGIRKWKKIMPTYDASQFDPRKHTWEEIASACARSETIHLINALLSFLPMVLTLYFGAFPVFLVTSAAGAAFDMMFVMIQRFNLARIVKAIEKGKK